jgi:hypothetical protein
MWRYYKGAKVQKIRETKSETELIEASQYELLEASSATGL